MNTQFTTHTPQLIREGLILVAKSNAFLSTANRQLETLKAGLFRDVLEATDANGKPKHSNDAARANALTLALSGNADIQNQLSSIAELEQGKAETLASIEALKMEFKLHLLDRELEIASLVIDHEGRD